MLCFFGPYVISALFEFHYGGVADGSASPVDDMAQEESATSYKQESPKSDDRDQKESDNIYRIVFR